MTVVSEGLLLNSKYILKWVARRRVFKLSSHSHLLCCLPCGLTVIHLRLFDRKKSLGAVSSLWTLVDEIHKRRE